MLDQLPLPYFKINSSYEVIHYSDLATKEFHTVSSFLSLLDDESVKKFTCFVQPQNSIKKIEINMKNKSNEIRLCDIHIRWSDNIATLLVHSLDKKYDIVEDQLIQLRTRLSETNFELYERKEQLNQLLQRVNSLSAPIIPLSSSICLIPVFGDLDSEKLNVISQNFATIYAKDYEKVLIDITGVDIINQNCTSEYYDLLLTLKTMGKEVFIMGFHPRHVKGLPFRDIPVIKSLEEAINRWLITK
ncbi:hypothetical protein [Evansella cellulosilytica]|uniref:STAS domain-containing protein n=1 Tax=Evansella cellulosilytica (strain ATCC 21833 / DSM 2522 / FERM P-1141 / JCM 9156 / N-4) TaxID=649639 RepID=E6U267_EVAC2|nr:hypothetical protein [Evansella cellulosilytica]ADU30445.1 hypothetical protein Bcell_2184 [Evansella cellulosilytica DSM 2522]